MFYHPLVGTIHGIETIKGVIKAKRKANNTKNIDSHTNKVFAER